MVEVEGLELDTEVKLLFDLESEAADFDDEFLLILLEFWIEK